MQQEIQNLKDRITKLEEMLSQKGGNFEEIIRDIVFFDVDNSTATTQVVTDSNGDMVTVGKIPTKFVKGYFRGQVYNFAIY